MTNPAMAIPLPVMVPADFYICDQAIWPKITAKSAGTPPTHTTMVSNPRMPSTRLATARPLFRGVIDVFMVLLFHAAH